MKKYVKVGLQTRKVGNHCFIGHILGLHITHGNNHVMVGNNHVMEVTLVTGGNILLSIHTN